MAAKKAGSAQDLVSPAHCFRVGEFERADRWPAWLGASVSELIENVGNPAYPCHFGVASFKKGELFATWMGRDEPVATLAGHLRAFLDATRPFPDRSYVLSVLFEPEAHERDHAWYGERFWSVLAGLRAADDVPWPSDVPTSTEDPKWEFCFHGVPMFVFAASPTHKARRSRALGPGLVLLFQPRNVFAGIEGGTPRGIAARRRVRQRLSAWDTVPSHPHMGSYGDPSNSEWRQYYIADDGASMYDHCPLDHVPEPGLHNLVAAAASRTPDAPAVIVGDTALSYRDLDRSANALAAELVRKGVRPDDRVGVMADRSAQTVVSLLAVLKAGAAYVPVDPLFPEERRVYLLEDSGVDIVVTPRRLVGHVPVGPRWLVLSDHPAGGEIDVDAPATDVRPDNLAYVLYTSGSTGTPKGVAVAHRQIVFSTLTQYAIRRPSPDVFLMPISFSLDASGVGVFHTLTAGGCVVLPSDDEHRDPARLRELIRHHGVTHMDCTPSLYGRVLEDDPESLRSLRCVQVGGEECPPHLVARHRELLPGCVFENNYGPTETTIWSTTEVYGPDAPLPQDRTPIGKALPGVTVHVLDGARNPVAPGESGELYIGGSGVARGYFARPALTAERFLPDPFSSRPGQRLYRTGDLVRQRPGGGLDFLGRGDAQVVVRGFRIELGEIEALLRRHPDVLEAVVDMRVLDGEPTLVAYLRPLLGGHCTDVALWAYLTPRLPEHMVPRRFVRVDQLPHTPGGKIDRSALPTPPATVQSDEGLVLR